MTRASNQKATSFAARHDQHAWPKQKLGVRFCGSVDVGWSDAAKINLFDDVALIEWHTAKY